MNDKTLHQVATIAATTGQSIEEVSRQIQAIASTRLTWTFEMVEEDVYAYFGECGTVPSLEQFEEWLKQKTAQWVVGQIKASERKRKSDRTTP